MNGRALPVVPSGAVFLDRDGVINRNRDDHVKRWAEFTFMPNVLESIRLLTATGLPVFVVTNQAVIARGLASEADIVEIHARMTAAIAEAGGHITRVYYCPHDARDNCDCRKPKPGMLLRAQREYGVDLTRSFMVGDAWTDVEAGLSVGARSILVMTGRGQRQFAQTWTRSPARFGAACDLADATSMILNALNGQQSDAAPAPRFPSGAQPAGTQGAVIG
ncbi:MAG: D-glycero-beta-D-manno-heptose 1,7-bisphosphate 7-phosphatase [Aggregatilineales bacterium]